jgi:hypothetical protein
VAGEEIYAVLDVFGSPEAGRLVSFIISVKVEVLGRGWLPTIEKH